MQNSIHLGVGFIVKSKNSEFSFKIVQNSAPQPCHSFTSLQFKLNKQFIGQIISVMPEKSIK